MSNKMVQAIAQGKKIFIGLEDSKRTWKLCVRCQDIVIQETSMPAKYTVLRTYLDNHFPGCSITIMYEAGFKGFTLHDKLVADGFACVVTPPHTVTQEKVNRVKCDKIDARRLALNLEKGDYKRCYVPEKQRRDDRQVSRTLLQVQKNIIRCKNRIRKFFDFNGYDEVLPAGRWFERDYQTIEKLAVDLPEPLAFCFQLYCQELRLLLDMKKRLVEKLKELSTSLRYIATVKLIESAPGIGWFTAIRLVLEWGTDFTRFPSGKHIASFSGLTCSESSSGETIYRGRISRQGNSLVRALLVECAWTAYKHDPVLLQKFQAVYSRTSSKKKAVVAVARKLVVRLRALVVTHKPYAIGLAA
jgi:transposase